MNTRDSGTQPRFLDSTIQSMWSVALNHPTSTSEDRAFILDPRTKEYTSTIFIQSPRFGPSRYFAAKFDSLYKEICKDTCLGQAVALPLKTHVQSVNREQVEWQDSYVLGPPYNLWAAPHDLERANGDPYPKAMWSPYRFCSGHGEGKRQREMMAATLTYGIGEYYAYVPILFDRYHSAVQLLFRSMSAKHMEYLLWNMLTRLTYYDPCDRLIHVIASSRFRRNKFYTVHTPFREHQRNCQFWHGRRAAFTLIRQSDAHSLPLLKFKSMFQQRAEALYSEVTNRSVDDGKVEESGESCESES